MNKLQADGGQLEFPSRALDAEIILIPNINNTGAAIPPAAIAPASQGISFLVKLASLLFPLNRVVWIKSQVNSPMPEPQ